MSLNAGWEAFHVDHDVEAGDLLVFTYAGVRFEVEMFETTSRQRGNPMEDEDLSYVKGLLASFEGEVHPPLPHETEEERGGTWPRAEYLQGGKKEEEEKRNKALPKRG
ncbi:hypothetical protein J5N97_030041 [Dioscorea zingiberensis]|uniref:TF-B3 domain-containing protein n=1 Tax=Dioscorea zingiberensis TaxID=325984 RepID=A0A9D5BWY2_9LILI|nr:hypothetical protein J5N97_030041 [Dioscorea zingiberensis]